MNDESMGPDWRAAAEAEYARLLEEMDWMEREIAGNRQLTDSVRFHFQDRLSTIYEALQRTADLLGYAPLDRDLIADEIDRRLQLRSEE